jgi:hypothetical protein
MSATGCCGRSCQNYIIRHVGRCIINSLTFEQMLLGYMPWQKVTVF